MKITQAVHFLYILGSSRHGRSLPRKGAENRRFASRGAAPAVGPEVSPSTFAEAAAAFEKLTLGGRMDQLKVQVPDAWPNLFCQARFLSAVDFVQADRLRRKVAGEMARVFSEVDLLHLPSLRDEMLTIPNFTGHPSLTMPAGFVEVSQACSDWAPDPQNPLPRFSPPRRVPHGITLIGRLFDEGTLGQVGLALERSFGVATARPPGFQAGCFMTSHEGISEGGQVGRQTVGPAFDGVVWS